MVYECIAAVEEQAKPAMAFQPPSFVGTRKFINFFKGLLVQTCNFSGKCRKLESKRIAKQKCVAASKTARFVCMALLTAALIATWRAGGVRIGTVARCGGRGAGKAYSALPDLIGIFGISAIVVACTFTGR